MFRGSGYDSQLFLQQLAESSDEQTKLFSKQQRNIHVEMYLEISSQPEPHMLKEEPRRRRRRSWLWNQFFVIEEYRGPEPVLIGRLHTDMDRGDGNTKYTLEGEGVGSVFVIDSNTGNIHVTKSLDREEKDQYRLIATATDRKSGRALEPSSEFIIRVQDINDNPPVFPHEPYVAVVPEMANIGTSIVQVTALDADDPTYGNSARLVYGIKQGQEYFSVDPQTGILRTAVPDMDRETQEEYLVVLQAKDMGGHVGGLSGTTTVTVKLSDVNDNPPHFRRSAWTFSVSELAAPGVEVGRLTATDPDLGENAQLEFAILDAEEAETFNVTGRDKEAVIVLNKLLDYETRSSYTFSVEVTNPVVDARFIRKGPFKDQATVRVMVLNADEPPKFSQAYYHLDVSENCPPVCSVGRVYAIDPDTGQSTNVRYSIDPGSDPEALFRIASDTGLVSTVMELDREQEQWHNITVVATQGDNPNLVSRVVVAIETLDQNDNAPELDRQYTTSVCDSSSPGQVVQVLRAVDRDQGGQDAPIHFSIPPVSSSALNLTVRETGGVTASLVLQSALEPLPGFSSSLLTLYVPVVLRDGASGLTNTGTVTVTICPCLQGGMQTEDRGRQRDRRWERHMVCLPVPSASPSLIFSLVTLLAMMACVTTLLVVCALSLSLRHQKRDSHSPFEEDDVRENIISYDDEGGGEADTAAFDITALFSWSLHPRSGLGPQQRPGSAPLYGRLCYGMHTLPVLRDYPAGPLEAGFQLNRLTQGVAGGHLGNSLFTPNQSTSEPLHRPAEAGLRGVQTCMNGSGLYSAGVQLLSLGRLQSRDRSSPSPPAGTSTENNGLPAEAQPGTAETAVPQPLGMEELLNIRLDRVTFDMSQPPYDSLQTYEFEGRDSRAESLSSLESDGEKDNSKAAGGMEELNQKFQRLLEIIRDRKKERDTQASEGGEHGATLKQTEEQGKGQQRWDF
uniref:Cadherin 24, type 2a n=1 Tax=Oryzias sinensis TaxID=183150 RepID=A0A8C7X708_9TELE